MIPGSANPLMLGGDPCEQYQIGYSVRFNAADTPNLSRTLAAGDTTRWTFSAWIKRSTLAAKQRIFISDNFSDNGTDIQFTSADQLEVYYFYGGAFIWRAVTNRVFRDTAAHFNLVVVLDTNNAVAADRLRIYIDGMRETSFSIAPSIALGQTGFINGNSYPHYISSPSDPLGAYLSEIHFVDGQALNASHFGFTCPSTGQWLPKNYAGTYGTNGFYLDFSDGSAATAGALGADRSGNGNNWTPTNISVTAGAGNDWLADTPTNNFATLNPLDISSGNTLSNGNLEVTVAGVSTIPRVSTVAIQSGKYYVEATAIGYDGNTGLENTVVVGIARPADLPAGLASKGVSYSSGAGTAAGIKAIDGATTAYGAYWATEGVSYVIGVALDLDAGTIDFSLNGVWQGSFSIPSSSSGWCFGAAWASTVGSGSVKWNFGQRAFAYVPPVGFKSLCTKNLPKSGTVTVSGSFTGNASADGPFVWMNGTPTSLTINGNAVTFGTHADALANGFKVRTNSASYNAAGTNNWTATITSDLRNIFKHQNAKGN